MLAARLARCAHAFRIGASINAPKLQFAGTIVKMGLVTSFVAVCNATSKCMDTTQVDEVEPGRGHDRHGQLTILLTDI